MFSCFNKSNKGLFYTKIRIHSPLQIMFSFLLVSLYLYLKKIWLPFQKKKKKKKKKFCLPTYPIFFQPCYLKHNTFFFWPKFSTGRCCIVCWENRKSLSIQNGRQNFPKFAACFCKISEFCSDLKITFFFFLISMIVSFWK